MTKLKQDALLKFRHSKLFEELYRTPSGAAIVARSEDYLPSLPDNSVDLVVTSPPFALLRQKSIRQSQPSGLRRLARVVRPAGPPRAQGDRKFRA